MLLTADAAVVAIAGFEELKAAVHGIPSDTRAQAIHLGDGHGPETPDNIKVLL